MIKDDPYWQKLISAPDAMEARKWLKTGRKRGFALVTLGELNSTEESLTIVEMAYAAGAVCVTAIEIGDYPDILDGLQTTSRLGITLPDTPSKRDKVFAWAGKIAEKEGFTATIDDEQRYLFVWSKQFDC